MKELFIKFDDFQLLINVQHQYVLHISWCGQTERYSMEEYFDILTSVRQRR